MCVCVSVRVCACVRVCMGCVNGNDIGVYGVCQYVICVYGYLCEYVISVYGCVCEYVISVYGVCECFHCLGFCMRVYYQCSWSV